MTADVSVVIPNLDGGMLLKRCLSSVAEQRGVMLELVLVDNASHDDSVESSRAIVPEVRIIQNDANQGFARACNQGCAFAKAPYILFLNSDVELSPFLIRDLLATARLDTGAVAWQPTIVDAATGEPEPSFSLFTPTGFLWHVHARGKNARSLTDAFGLKGACLLVEREAFERVGGFDEAFFAYFEESDLCWRFHLRGWSTRYVAVGSASHVGGATTNKTFSPEEVDFLAFRNRLRSIVKNSGAVLVWVIVPIHLASCALLAALFVMLGHPCRASAVLRALRAVAKDWAALQDQRRLVQASRCVKDREFLPALTMMVTPVAVLRFARRYVAVRVRPVPSDSPRPQQSR